MRSFFASWRHACVAVCAPTPMLALGSAARAQTDATPPPAVARTILSVTSKPVYAHSTWGIMLVDESSGATLLDRMGEKMFVRGSIMKTYSSAAALAEYGPGYRFQTPVYRTGALREGVLTGNLVLLASGDFSFGLRERSDGTLGFNSIPEIDHNYASTGFVGPAIVKGSDPLAALNELARHVRASGIRDVRGNIAIAANLSLSLFGLTHEQRTIGGALAAERRTLITTLGIPANEFEFPS